MPSERQLSEVLREFARTMVTDFPIQGILEHLVLRMVEILPITAAGVTLISANTGPRYVAASNESALRYEQLQSELGEGPCLGAYLTGEAVIVADLRADDRFKVFGPRAVEAGLAAVFTFPLHQADKPLGALDLYRDTPGPLDDDDIEAAQILADVTAAYLVNAQTRADLQAASERSYQSSVHDALTGLANRVLLRERLEHALLRGRRSGKIVAILFADLDRFKAVNDIHGHRIGDDLLIGVAQRLAGLLRPGDTLARMSGDEFVILCEDLANQSQAEVIASRIVASLSVPFELSGNNVSISASVGVAFAGLGEHMPEHLIQDADVAMYQAKREGGARYRVIDLRDRHLAGRRATLRHDLPGVVERGELRVDYQPIGRIADGRVVGAEALLRWDHPVRGPISPTIVVPVAEQAGLLTEIGRWVLQQACADRHRWIAEAGHDEVGEGNLAPDDLGVAVNVSAHQLMAPDFVAIVAEVLAGNHTRPELLTLELTETVFVRDGHRALIVLEELKRLGVMLALDDFGTGYSSLSYLQRFPLDIVKIDQTVTTHVTGDRASHAIVGKVIELAHLLDMAVVAEGVETAEQLHEVGTLGSEFCQGFYFARPMPVDQLQVLTR
jgi:diguanylate cyclase (GGDEF)-like protein